MKKILIILLLTAGLFANCKTDMVSASSGAENAVDYAQNGNHKYALIEVNLALEYTKYALDSCQGIISSYEMDELIKNISSLCKTQKKIEEKLPNLTEQAKSKYCKKDIIISSSSEEDVAYFTTNSNKAIHSCEMGNGAACYTLADKYFKSKKMSKAPEYFRKSCDNGYPKGCDRLGLIYVLAQGVSKDYGKPTKYYKKGCEGNYPDSCMWLGVYYVDGTGVKKDKFKAMDLFNKACDLGNQIACKEYLKLMP